MSINDISPASLLKEQQAHIKSQQLEPGEENHYRIWQNLASPYSYKVMTYMNYKGIPYKRIAANMKSHMEDIPRMVGQSIVPVMLSPNGDILQDSTPIIEWLEERHPDKPVVPEDARLAFLMWLLEELADEYMPRIHMHTRWGNRQNQNAVSHRIGRELAYAIPDASVSDLAAFMLSRQAGFNKHLGLTDRVRENMDRQVLDLLFILDDHFLHYQFLLGDKPSLADFALYGSLKVHLYSDPNSKEIMEVHSPKTCNWIEKITALGDVRGCVGQTTFGDWINLYDGVPKSLHKLLSFSAKTYIPFAQACAQASKNKSKTFDAEVYGLKETFSTHQYRVWSFEQLQNRYEKLHGDEKQFVDEALKSSGVLPLMMAEGIVHSDLFDGFTPPVIKNGATDARIRYLLDKGGKAGML